MSADTVHVVPVDDLIEHELEGVLCVCGPALELVRADDDSVGWLVVHASLDGRELDEVDGLEAN